MAGVKGGRLSAAVEVGELTSLRQSSSGANWSQLRNAYSQAKGNLDFAHIEVDVQFGSKIKAQGGHFSASENWAVQEGYENLMQIYPNGVVRARIDLLGSDGNYYEKTNGKSNGVNGWSTLTPFDWSMARAKGEMANAWVNREPVAGKSYYEATSSGVKFKFVYDTKIQLWRGYPLAPEVGKP